MTISTSASSTTVMGDGSNTSFNFSFVADSPLDIEVIYTDADGAQTTLDSTSYLLTINPPALGQIWGIGGTVNYPLMGSPIGVGTSLTITRILPLTQNITISNQGDFAPGVIEEMGDTLEMQIQQVSARTGQLRGTWITNANYNFGDIVTDGANGNNTGNLYTCAISNTSDVWTTDLAAGDWSLALNVQGIVNALPQIANNRVFANISGMAATPVGVSVSALIDSAIGNTQGGLLYRSGSEWTILTPGSNGQVLQTQGAGANPQWASAAGAGTVTSIATNNGITGGTITNSGTLGLASIANLALLANISGGATFPIATTLSALFDAILGSSQGSLIYRGASSWGVLTPGTNGQFLQTQGSSANPQWASASIVTATPVSAIGNPLIIPVDFTTYAVYDLILTGVSSDNALPLQASSNAGSNYTDFTITGQQIAGTTVTSVSTLPTFTTGSVTIRLSQPSTSGPIDASISDVTRTSSSITSVIVNGRSGISAAANRIKLNDNITAGYYTLVPVAKR